MQDFLLNLTTVSEQVFILAILMFIGFICGKAKMFDDNCVKLLADFCLKFATPAVIIKSFIREYDSSMALDLGLAFIMAILCHLIAIGIATVAFRDKDLSQRSLYRNTAAFSNAAFMGMPLQIALLGDKGAFFGAAFAVVLTLFLWTYSYKTMSCGQVKMNFKKIFLNPGVIAVVVGLPIFLFSIKLPSVVSTTINHIAGLNTPLPMIVVGYYISNIDFKTLFSNMRQILSMAYKLVFIPLVCLGVLYLLGFSGTKLIATIISVSAPGAVAITMFAAKFGGDTEGSSKMVAVSTLFSIITMPLIVALTQSIA